MRQALAGMLWSKQYFGFDVSKWLEEHGAGPMTPGAPEVRNSEWFGHGERAHYFHAGQVGIPVVCRMGLGVPAVLLTPERRVEAYRRKEACEDEYPELA
jgi:hypothetical protein